MRHCQFASQFLCAKFSFVDWGRNSLMYKGLLTCRGLGRRARRTRIFLAFAVPKLFEALSLPGCLKTFIGFSSTNLQRGKFAVKTFGAFRVSKKFTLWMLLLALAGSANSQARLPVQAQVVPKDAQVL